MAELSELTIEGERYEATVPDTLDLSDRAELALNGLGGTTDPERDYQMYWEAQFRVRPPYLRHRSCDPTNTPKMAESYPMMRLMSGTDTYVEAQRGMMAGILRDISPDDGLYYAVQRPDRPWLGDVHHSGYEASGEDFANVAGNGRVLRAMVAWRELSGDPGWDDVCNALVRGLNKIAIHRDDYAFFPDGGFGEAFNYPRSGWRRTEEPGKDDEGGEGSVTAYQGHQLQGLARWYALSGDEVALELAGELARFCMLPRFWGAYPEPAMVSGQELGHFNMHMHARAIALRGMLEYGIVSDDYRIKEFVRSSYEYARTLGIPRMGWYANWPLCEGCTMGDMVALPVRLSDAGLGDYWDDVDQIARNHLIEMQVVSPELLERVSQTGPERPPGSQWLVPGWPAVVHPGQIITDNVIERSIGTYFNISTPTSIPNPALNQCCTGNGTQGLYYAWEGITRCKDGTAEVNLLLNRAAPWVDVDSYLPYEGKVIIKNKTAKRIMVRIPAWVNRRELRCRVGDEDRAPFWAGNYAGFDDVQPNDEVSVEFPVVDSTAEYTILAKLWRQEQKYTISFRGSTVVDIAPRDQSATAYPLYIRDHMRGDRAPVRTKTRFVAPKVIARW